MSTLIAALSDLSTLVVWSVVAVGTGIADFGKSAYEALMAEPRECRNAATADLQYLPRKLPFEKAAFSPKTDDLSIGH